MYIDMGDEYVLLYSVCIITDYTEGILTNNMGVYLLLYSWYIITDYSTVCILFNNIIIIWESACNICSRYCIYHVKFTSYCELIECSGPIRFLTYLSNTLSNLCIALYGIPLHCIILNCIVLLIYCYVDIIQYNAMHKFVGVLDNPHF